MIVIKNAGQAISETNYWTSPQAEAGFFYLSWNAGAARLLVPAEQKATIRDMLTAEFCIVSRGPWAERDGQTAFELLFEDHSDAPFSITLLTEQSDRLIPERDQGAGFDVVLWTATGMKGRLPGRYRVVDALPCLRPWREQ
jgi:hypothetical protein